MATKDKKEKFIAEQKKQATIKVRTLINIIGYLVVAVAFFILGSLATSRMNDYVRSEVSGQIQNIKTAAVKVSQ